MLFISNDCTGGEICRKLNYKYNNPFVWSTMLIDDFVFLINNWNTIDFNNYQIFSAKGNTKFINVRNFEKNNDKMYYTVFDNKISAIYTHFIEIPGGEPHKDNTDFCTPNCKEYIDGEIKKHNKRMYESKEFPIFVLNEKRYYSEADIMKFINADTPYTRILYTKHPKYKQYEKPGIKIIVNEHLIYGNSYKFFAKEIKNIYSEQ